MRSVFKIQNPGAIECSMTTTMTLAEWQKLSTQMQSSDHSLSHPMYRFINAIDELVSHASQQFVKPEDGPEKTD